MPITLYSPVAISLVFAMNWYRTKGGYCGYIIVFKLSLLLLQANVAISRDSQSVTGYYTLTAASSIYSSRPYGVVLATFNCNVKTSFEVSISGPSISVSMQLNTSPMHPYSSHVFTIPQLVNGTYWLRVKSLQGLKADSSTQLMWRYFMSFIKFQTAKTLYRPGELMQFTVFYHNETMQGVIPHTSALIWIEDSKGNRVRIYNNFSVTKGIFQSELHLSRQPNLGNWRICSTNGIYSVEECAIIRVEHYELPPFEVSIDAPAVVKSTEKSFEVKIEAKYAINRPINGNLTLYIRTLPDSKTSDKPLLLRRSATLINGQAMILLPLSYFTSFRMPLKIRLRVLVQEQFTDRHETTTKVVTLWDDSKESLKNTTVDGVILQPAPPVRLNLIKIPKFGTPLKIPRKIRFELSHKLTNAICVVLVIGRVVGSGEVFPEKNTNNFDIQIQFTTKMWPFVDVVLYSMEAHSDVLIVASQTITVSRIVQEHIYIEAPTQVRPGEEIQFRIKTLIDSYVGLTAIDNRLIRIAGDSINDFNPDYFNDLKYSMRETASVFVPNKQLFHQTSGLIFLSSAANVLDITKDTQSTTTRSELRRNKHPADNSTHIRKQVSSELETICCQLPKVEEQYNDVWIYDSIKSTKAGWTNWKTRVPDAIANWRLSAFSVNSVGGLTLLALEPFIDIQSSKLVFMSIDLPYSIKVGEVLKLFLICSNQHEIEVDVEINLNQDVNRYQLLNDDGTPLPVSDFAKQNLQIMSYQTNAVTFNLHALRAGTLNLTFNATSDIEWDILNREIVVLNSPQLSTSQVVAYKKLTMNNPKTKFNLHLPHQPSDDGVKCFVSSHVVISKLNKLNLLTLSDNGEELISKMMSIYHLWNYVKDKKWLSNRYKKYLEVQLSDGFQSLLRLHASNGGFQYNAAKSETICSSTWLTTFALQLIQLLKNTSINFEDSVERQAEKFLINRIVSAGHFEERCETPGRRKIETLELNIEVLKVLQYSNRKLPLQGPQKWTNDQMNAENDYHLLAKRGLEAIKWKRPENHSIVSWMEQRRNLETAGRILSRNMGRVHVDQQPEIFNWLTVQLFEVEKTIECYECSVAKQAFYEYLQNDVTNVPRLNVSIWGKKNRKNKTQISINDKNRWLQQQVLIATQAPIINLKAEGIGQLLIRCTYQHVPEEVNAPNKRYQISVKTSKDDLLNITFCVTRNQFNLEDYVGSNIELHLPSGHVLDHGSVQKLPSTQIVHQANEFDEQTKLFVNLVGLKPGESSCMSVVARNYHKLNHLKPGMVYASDMNDIKTSEAFAFQVTFS